MKTISPGAASAGMVTLDDVGVVEAVPDKDPVAEAVNEDPVAEGAVVDEDATVVCCLG